MPQQNADLAAIIGSRICHDLISPIGAIHNGLELISLSGQSNANTPELELIQQSCDNAAAKIQFFRIAFGSAASEQLVRHSEAKATLERLAAGGRMKPDWRAQGNFIRSEVQIAYLAYLCLESALPMGGDLVLDHRDGQWHISATTTRIIPLPDLWKRLTGAAMQGAVAPAHVQFELLALVTAGAGRPVHLDQSEGRIALQI